MSKSIFTFALLLANLAQAQPSLRTVPVPQATNTGDYVRDRAALTVLGKALFWDMQLGSDGRTACATCHFHAGADHRSQNQLSNPNFAFPANIALTSADFPFHALADPTSNNSRVLHDNSSRFGSAGIFNRKFTAINLTSGDDGYDLATAAAFAVNGLNVRQVTTRNAPSVFNAVFNARNFWDGRALNTFTLTGSTNASLASQAVGPPTNSVEMAYDGLTWPVLGQRMLALNPLRLQRIAADDSLLGPFANPNGPGFAAPISYLSLVQAAFAPAYWQTAPEDNFQLFFAMALQAYQTTLVSDDTPFDRFAAGDTTALTGQEQAGLNLFRGRAQCSACHTGAEFTLASVGGLNRRNNNNRNNNNNSVGDTGFFRTGVSPLAEDIGLLAGAFKTPGLRNVEFTGPYFHNGGQATLEQVVEFYNRGGDFPQGGVDNDIRRLNLSVNERAQLVAFLKSLSDDRVRFQRAPFDHPALCVPNGATDLAQTSDARFTISAADRWAAIPATGKAGAAVPLQSFAELLDGIGADGSRANALNQACAIE